MKDYLKEQLERTNYWLSFSEAKNGALVAVNVGVIAVCVQMKAIPSSFNTIVCVCFLLSTMFCLFSFYPNLTSKYYKYNGKDTEKINLSFYGDIAKIEDVEKYIDLVQEKYRLSLDYKEMSYDLATEVMINSRIALVKFRLFKRAVFTDIVAIILLIIGIILA